MGQQHPEPGLIQPQASEDITFACGKISGEGFGQDLDPLASFQSGWAMSGLCWFFYLGQFGGGCVQESSFFLWLWIHLAFGVLVVVVVRLGRGS